MHLIYELLQFRFASNSTAKDAVKCCARVLLARVKWTEINSHLTKPFCIMKNLLLTGFIIILCSCSNEDFTDSDFNLDSKESLEKAKSSNLPTESISEKNFQEVKAGNYFLLMPSKVKDRIISVLKSKAGHNELLTTEKNSSGAATISSEEDPVTALFIIVDESTLVSSLKLDVKGYIVNLGSLRGESYELVDDFIIQYEISKRQDSTLLTNEKETILSISSISEAVLFSEKDRKDRDWETSTTSKRAK